MEKRSLHDITCLKYESVSLTMILLIIFMFIVLSFVFSFAGYFYSNKNHQKTIKQIVLNDTTQSKNIQKEDPNLYNTSLDLKLNINHYLLEQEKETKKMIDQLNNLYSEYNKYSLSKRTQK